MDRSIVVLGLLLALAGCSAAPQSSVDDFPRHPFWQDDVLDALDPVSFELADRIALPQPGADGPDGAHETLYSFVISNMEIGEALHNFSRAFGLNMTVAPNVVGITNAEFHDLPFAQAMALLLEPLGYYWIYEDDLIKVRSTETRQFTIDYLRLVRTGESVATAKVSSGSSSGDGGDSGGGGEDGGEEDGSFSVGHADEVRFWDELESQVRSLLSPSGKLVINRLSGSLLVSDQHRYVSDVAAFIDHLERGIHRQVDIQVTIMEVALDDTTALGVDWTRIAEVIDPTDAVSLNLNGRVLTPAGGIPAEPDVLDLTYRDEAGSRNITGLLTALSQQGEVEIVSQPHVRAMNNQTALIKVGTDRTFFRREQSVDSTSAGSITTATDVPQVVTEGVVLSITPQVSNNGWIMMDISPVVTRVSSVTTVQNDSGQVQSSAPNLDVAQVTSLVRAKSGDTVVIGGLIQTVESRKGRNLPGTGWMGRFRNLTGGVYGATLKKELVMVLTPVIVEAG